MVMRNDEIQIEPLTGYIGAEIHGVDLREPLNDGMRDIVHRALMEHLVVFFRDQALTPDQHVAFGKQFGELHIHPSAPGVHGRDELMMVHTDASSPWAEGTTWHTDVSCDAEPPMASILHLTSVPDVGGDTLFASMYAAYDALSDNMKKILDPMMALHTGEGYHGRYEEIGGAQRRKYESSAHPVVRTHPVTGRKAIFVNAPFTDHIVGLNRPESDALLNFLYAHSIQPNFQCRFKWRKNSIAFWDNRCVQHHATWDYFPQTRSGIRVTIKGDKPIH
jgi:taurine dioxygenase